MIRYAITDLVKDLDDISADGNTINFNLLIGLALDKVIEVYFGLRCIWLPKPKYRLEEIMRREPTIEPLIESILIGDVANLYKSLIRRVGILEPRTKEGTDLYNNRYYSEVGEQFDDPYSVLIHSMMPYAEGAFLPLHNPTASLQGSFIPPI